MFVLAGKISLLCSCGDLACSFEDMALDTRHTAKSKIGGGGKGVLGLILSNDGINFKNSVFVDEVDTASNDSTQNGCAFDNRQQVSCAIDDSYCIG
jgi:hypothetical protein